MRVLVAIDRTEIPRLSSVRGVLPETGTVAARAAREAIGRRRLHQDQNSRTEPYLLGALASMRARRVGASCEAHPVPEAVIFDLDGVLLDSEQLWNRAKEQLTRCSGGGWHEDAPTVTGETIGAIAAAASETPGQEVIRPLARPIKPTGARIAFPTADFWYLRDGKVEVFDCHIAFTTLFAQLGVQPDYASAVGK